MITDLERHTFARRYSSVCVVVALLFGNKLAVPRQRLSAPRAGVGENMYVSQTRTAKRIPAMYCGFCVVTLCVLVASQALVVAGECTRTYKEVSKTRHT